MNSKFNIKLIMKITVPFPRALILLLALNNCLAQTAPLTIKEDFDKLYMSPSFFGQNLKLENLFFNDDDCDKRNSLNILGDSHPYLQESLLNMYEITGDKGYLYKFIKNAIAIQNMRYDRREGIARPTFEQETRCNGNEVKLAMYHDGQITWPMAHFVYLVQVKYHAELYNEPLPQLTDVLHNPFGQSWPTYGSFSNWLKQRTYETINWYLGDGDYWKDNYVCFTPEPGFDRAAHVNMQAGFGAGLLYLGIAYNNNSFLLEKAAQIGDNFMNGFRVEDKNCFLGVPWYVEAFKVLEHKTSDNSYIWKDSGWRRQICTDFTHDYEDVSHSVQTLNIVKSFHNMISTNGNMIVDDNDMVRFHNTYTQNIYAGDNGTDPIINAAVDGDNVILYNASLSGQNTQDVRQGALGYSRFSSFDNYNSSSYGSVYDINTRLYRHIRQYYIENFESAISVLGITELLKEQWERECTSLTLFNRHLVYNQDFSAKNTLVVDPALAENSTCFADPVITSNAFTVTAQAKSKFTAGESIVLKPGFTAKKGCEFKASIDPALCSDGLLVSNSRRGGSHHEVPDIILPEKLEPQVTAIENEQPVKQQAAFTAYPNPNNGTFSVEYPAGFKGEVRITNLLGKIIMEATVNDRAKDGFKLADDVKGMYIIHLSSNGELMGSKKIIVQ